MLEKIMVSGIFYCSSSMSLLIYAVSVGEEDWA
jgi:hypothetical protein